jgi:hypothetical protein
MHNWIKRGKIRKTVTYTTERVTVRGEYHHSNKLLQLEQTEKYSILLYIKVFQSKIFLLLIKLYFVLFNDYHTIVQELYLPSAIYMVST